METIRITGKPQGAVCHFVLAPSPAFSTRRSFQSSKQAEGEVLFERLFAVPGVKGVAASGQTITIRKADTHEWKTVGKEVAAVIRANFPQPEAADLKEQIQAVLDEKINPAVASHGGHIAVVQIQDDSVIVNMSGGCQGCGMASATLQEGVEKTIREAFPQIKNVIDSTEHEKGEHPFFEKS